MYRVVASDGADPARLFVAVWPSRSVQAALAAAADVWAWPAAARRTRPERLHLTLHFIGDVPMARLDELRAHLRLPFEPFDIELGRPDVWRGGIAVLEANAIPAPLHELHARLAQALRTLGLPVEERAWRPHVTLARKAFGLRPPAEVPPVRWRADEGYRLVQSLPGGRGYEPLAGFD